VLDLTRGSGADCVSDGLAGVASGLAHGVSDVADGLTDTTSEVSDGARDAVGSTLEEVSAMCTCIMSNRPPAEGGEEVYDMRTAAVGGNVVAYPLLDRPWRLDV
jgi:hypothetical protein